MKKRRLLVVTPYFAAHGGGIESVAWQLIRHMSAQDPALQIEWMASDCDAPPVATKGVRFLRGRGWNGIEKKTGLPVPLWSVGTCARLWRAIRRSDVVHFHDVAYLSSILTALFCVLQGKPYFVTQHIGEVPMKSPVLSRALGRFNAGVGVWILNRARGRVFISNEVRRYFGELGVEASELIANGVDKATFFPVSWQERQRLRAREGIAPDARVVLFAGRFVPKKGVPFALSLAEALPDVKWIFAGQGPLDPGDAPLPHVLVMRDRRGMAMGDLFRLADALVLPSTGEGFPLVVQEALACGTPVLVESKIGEAAPQARKWMNFESLTGGDDDGERWTLKLRSMLEEISTNRTTDEERRAARARWAQREWDWDGCARAYLELFEQRSVRRDR